VICWSNKCVQSYFLYFHSMYFSWLPFYGLVYALYFFLSFLWQKLFKKYFDILIFQSLSPKLPQDVIMKLQLSNKMPLFNKIALSSILDEFKGKFILWSFYNRNKWIIYLQQPLQLFFLELHNSLCVSCRGALSSVVVKKSRSSAEFSQIPWHGIPHDFAEFWAILYSIRNLRVNKKHQTRPW
jgi:hypothetical protein